MAYEKFDVARLERLNDERRFEGLPPDVMWHAVGDPHPATIVDLGAGTGLFACRFAQMAPEADVYAIDVEPAMVRWMLEHRPESLCARLHPLLGAEAAIPLGTGEADLVLMINLHHELADPLATYRDALRVLRIGGKVLVADWAPDEEPGGAPQHVRASAEQIADMLARVGFESIAQHPGLPRHSLITAAKPAVCAL